MADQKKTAFAPGGWRDVWRALALVLFVFAHMQDVLPALCPASVALVGITYLPDVIWYRRWPLVFLLPIVFTAYELVLFFVHHNYADGTAKVLFFTNGRYLYLFIVFTSFAHIRATARFEPLLFNAALVAGCGVSLLCLFSLFVKPLTVGTAPLSYNGAVTGMLGANNEDGADGAEKVRNSKNAMGLAVGTILAMVVAGYLHRFRWRWPRCTNFFTMLLAFPILVAFLLAKSRGCLLAFTMVMLVASFLVVRRYPRWQNTLIALIVLVGLGGYIANAQRDSHNTEDNVWDRVEVWTRGVRLLSQSPVIGIGIGSFEQVGVHYHRIIPYVAAVRTSGRTYNGPRHWPGPGATPLNSYLQILMDFGILGFLLYFGWLWQAARLGRETLEPDPRDDAVSEMLRQHANWNLTVVGMTLAFVGTEAMTETCVFLGPNGLMIFAACFGRLVSQVHTLRTRRAVATAPAPSNPAVAVPLYATA